MERMESKVRQPDFNLLTLIELLTINLFNCDLTF